MIKIEALYFLLLIELLLVLAGTTALLAFRGKKFKALYKNSMQNFEKESAALKELQKQLAESGTPVQQAPEAGAATAAPAADTKKFENCKIELSILESKLKEKTTLLNDLQAKFDDLEKEYLILYRQQQKQEAEASKP